MALRSFIHRHPRVMSVARPLARVVRVVRGFFLRSLGHVPVSTNYQRLNDAEVGTEVIRLRDSWKNEALPARQRALVDRQIELFKDGTHVDVFDVFIEALNHVAEHHSVNNLLEIGCSSGYYGEVMVISGLSTVYRGCDYSEALITLARERYPNMHFDVEDATDLSYSGKSFDVVVSGCCLQHIPEYEAAIREAARVAKFAVIFHRTPVLENSDNEFFRKNAYGVETFEIHFSEQRLFDIFTAYGLTVEKTILLSKETLPSGVVKAVRTYVCYVK